MPRTSTLAHLSIDDLKREIASRQRQNAKLERKRQTLLRKITVLERQMGIKGGRGAASRDGRTRPRNESSLLTALQQVLKDKTMTIAEATEAVQKSGYQSSSPNFRQMVNVTLLNKKAFKRVGRGQYTAK